MRAARPVADETKYGEPAVETEADRTGARPSRWRWRPACRCSWQRSIVVVPSGMGGVRISQIERHAAGNALSRACISSRRWWTACRSSTCAITFSPPGLVQEGVKSTAQRTGLDVQSREGLNIGLGVTVRYRLDPNKLASVQAHLPQPADKELVPPVVASAWRELAPAVHGARNLLDQTRGSALQSCGNHHPQAR